MVVVSESGHLCPVCGTSLIAESWGAGLCPRCLMDLVVDAPSLLDDIEVDPIAVDDGEGDTDGDGGCSEDLAGSLTTDQEPTLQFPGQSFSPGSVLGKRYQIRALLGRGGMGEVWRAFDLKLRVDVALKALRLELLRESRALEALRDEVRSAREVVSPNVCRVFDLIEIDGQELVSMEYIDGINLLDILKMRAPLEISEAREIASQFLAGLEAIHQTDLVHRDLKPENLMMTRAGRVVVMDFGIAKSLVGGSSETVSGTPAYMAPEQAMGEPLSPAADVFSAGVVLAEMIAPGGLGTLEARQKVWKSVRSEPPALPESPWSAVLKRALAPAVSRRYSSAAALARALEEVTLRVAGSEEIQPYPGLASFTENDAEYFFGRELEVEEMWKKLRRAHLLGLIGPSGAGKSSFLRAGLLKVTPSDWRALVTTPGSQPFRSLARALAPELSGDAEAVDQLLGFDEPEMALAVLGRWRSDHEEVLLVVDQFEELFTQNPSEVQASFADLLARLAVEVDVHVLLSMRDDFLFYCSSQPALAPMFTELTPLRPPTGAALRRALIQPALKGGYRFEDDGLVDEMIEEITHERGALPMLAFAAARLWDHRDRERGLLTREAYEHVGGVGGALAQHAEATLEKIGQDNVPVVREIFRNLVTSQGTRAARTRAELLSVFDGSGTQDPPAVDESPPAIDASGVLDTLIDARLLTAYEEPGNRRRRRAAAADRDHPRITARQLAPSGALADPGCRQRRSCAINYDKWPRSGMTGDTPRICSGTGTSFKEFELWRERYAGGLSTGEEAFARAMKSKAERRKRQKRLMLGGVGTVCLLSWVLWLCSGSGRSARRVAPRRRSSWPWDRSRSDATRQPHRLCHQKPRARRFRGGTPGSGRGASKGPPAQIVYDGPSRRHMQNPDGRFMVHDTSRGDGKTNGYRIAFSDGSGRTLIQIEGLNTISTFPYGRSKDRFFTVSRVPDPSGIELTFWSSKGR